MVKADLQNFNKLHDLCVFILFGKIQKNVNFQQNTGEMQLQLFIYTHLFLKAFFNGHTLLCF